MDTQEARSVDLSEVPESLLGPGKKGEIILYGYCHCGNEYSRNRKRTRRTRPLKEVTP